MTYRIAAGIAILLLAGGPAFGRQAWDQAAVNALATDLAAATSALRDTLRAEPQIAQGAQAGDRDAVGLLESVDTLAKSARRLSRSLGDGKGYEATLPIATRIDRLVGAAEQYGAGVMTAAWMRGKIEPVQDLRSKLARFYFD